MVFINMKRFLLLGTLISSISNASCFDTVGSKYRLDPDYLRAIAFKESKYKPQSIGKNKDGTIDIGMMQINSSNIDWLRRAFPDISIRKLLVDTCYNIHVGGYVLNENFKIYGRRWVAVGDYNAGGKNNPKRIKIRYNYAREVNNYYNQIKKGTLRLPRVKA